MARKLRIEYAGAIYHVMNRGDRREAILENLELRSKTPLPPARIASRLNMGSRGYLAWLLRRRGCAGRSVAHNQCELGM